MTADQLLHRRTGKPWQVRRDAVIACSKAYSHGKVNYDQAYRYLHAINEGECASSLAGHAREFLRRTWEKFYQHGSMEDAHRSGRPHKVPPAVAVEAAELLMEGTWYTVVTKGKRYQEKMGYTSIHDACSQLARLREIMAAHNVDEKGLLHAMQQQVPELTRHAVYFKREFTAEQLAGRLSLAAQLLQSLPAAEAARAAWLNRLVWIDEGGIMLSDYAKKHVKVWCRKHDISVHHMVHMPWVKGQEACKAHFILAVTSHPALADRNGLLYWEFTTGTTDIRRRFNTLGVENEEQFVYQVSPLAAANTVLP